MMNGELEVVCDFCRSVGGTMAIVGSELFFLCRLCKPYVQKTWRLKIKSKVAA